MKNYVLTLTCVVIILTMLQSCDNESECDSKDYSTPLISLVNPDDAVVEAIWDTMMEVEFSLQAEGGLNTVTFIDEHMYERAVTAFLEGETEAIYKFSMYAWEDMVLDFKLYDLCNNASESITVEIIIIEAP